MKKDIIVFSKSIEQLLPLWEIEELRLTQIGQAVAMIERVFDAFISPGYDATGIKTFKSFIQPAEFAKRSLEGNFVLVAKDGDIIVGVLEVKNYEHISLLFVAKEYHRKGIAKQLFSQALCKCRTERPEGTQFTVNSSPFAVPVYQRLGFTAVGPEQIRDGIRFVPMILEGDARNNI